MREIYYKVAEHVFVLKTHIENGLQWDLRQYEPFLTDPADDLAFSLEIVDELPVKDFYEEMRQDDEGQTIVVGHIEDGSS